jgi:hypothetical protein
VFVHDAPRAREAGSTKGFSTPKSVFGSVVAGAFQIAFRAEMHANDVFLFFKNHF